MEREEQKSSPIPALLVVIGGALIIVSNFLHWGRVAATDGSGHRDLKGGTAVLIAGIVAVVLGLLWGVLRSRRARIVLSIVVMLGGLVAVLIGAIGMSTDFIRNVVADQLGDENGISHAEAEQDLKASEQAGKITTTRQPGIYFALAGGLLVLVGGIAGLVAAARTPAEPVPAGEPGMGFDAPPPPVGMGAEPVAPADMPSSEGPGMEPAPPPPPPAEPAPSEPPPPEPPPPPESSPPESPAPA